MLPTPVLLLLAGLLLGGCSSTAPSASGGLAAVPGSAVPTAGRPADVPILPTAPTGSTPTARGATATPTTVRSTPDVPQDPLSPAPALESPAPVGQPTCRPAALTLIDADQLTGSGAVREVFTLRTTGATCQLQGYPVVRLLDASGATLPVTYRHGGYGLSAAGAVPVTLSRDTTASLELGTGRTGTCRDAATVVVTLPGTTTALRTRTGFRVCGGAVGVSPILRRGDTEG